MGSAWALLGKMGSMGDVELSWVTKQRAGERRRQDSGVLGGLKRRLQGELRPRSGEEQDREMCRTMSDWTSCLLRWTLRAVLLQIASRSSPT